MFGVYHISLLTELWLSLSPASYKHLAPTELRTLTADMEFTLDSKIHLTSDTEEPGRLSERCCQGFGCEELFGAPPGSLKVSSINIVPLICLSL